MHRKALIRQVTLLAFIVPAVLPLTLLAVLLLMLG